MEGSRASSSRGSVVRSSSSIPANEPTLVAAWTCLCVTRRRPSRVLGLVSSERGEELAGSRVLEVGGGQDRVSRRLFGVVRRRREPSCFEGVVQRLAVPTEEVRGVARRPPRPRCNLVGLGEGAHGLKRELVCFVKAAGPDQELGVSEEGTGPLVDRGAAPLEPAPKRLGLSFREEVGACLPAMSAAVRGSSREDAASYASSHSRSSRANSRMRRVSSANRCGESACSLRRRKSRSSRWIRTPFTDREARPDAHRRSSERSPSSMPSGPGRDLNGERSGDRREQEEVAHIAIGRSEHLLREVPEQVVLQASQLQGRAACMRGEADDGRPSPGLLNELGDG